MIFKTLNGDLTVFNKTLISTKDHLKSLQTINATVYNKNGAFNLQGLLVNSSQSVSTFTKLNNAFKAYNGNLSKSTQLQNAYVQAVGKQNTSLGNYLAGLNGAKASIGGYVKSLVAAKAASIGLQVASVALNAAISMGITLAISALVSAITKWVNKEKEAREEAIENAKAAKEEANNLSELLNKYNQLSKEVKSNQGVKEDLLSVQSDLLEALGIEASQIDTLIEKYGDLNSAINQITLDSLRDAQGDLMVAIDAYEKDLIKVGKGYAHWYSLFDRNLLSTGQSSTDALDILEKAGIISSGSHGEGGGALVLTGNDKTVEGILENYQKLKDAQEALNEAIDNGEITMEEMIKIPLYNDINSRLDELEESIDNYNTAIADLNKNMAQQQILKSLAEQSSIPETKEEFEAFQKSMIDTAIASTKFKGSQDDIRDSIINVLSVMPEFEKYFEELNDVQSSTSNIEYPISFSSALTNSTESLDKFQSSVKSAADAYTTLLSGNYSSSELLDSIQAINQAVTDMDGTLNWDLLDLSYEPLELLGRKLEDISRQYAESILSGAGIDADSEFGQMLTNIIQEMYEAEAKFDGMNTQLDNLQSSYQTLTGILESYNETGYISLDNLQSLLTADENLIAMLEVENGQLVLNQEAYENLVAVQLLEFKAKLNDAAAAEIEALAKNKAEQATNQNADASDNAVAKLDAETAAINRNTSAAISNAVAKAEEAGVSEAEIQSVLDKYNEVWNAAVNNFDGDFDSFMGGTKAASSAGSSAGDAYVNAFEEELKALEELRSDGLISEKEYLDRLRVDMNALSYSNAG